MLTKSTKNHTKKQQEKPIGFFKSWTLPLEAVGVTIFTYLVPSIFFVTLLQLVFQLDTKEKFREFIDRPVINFSIYLFIATVSFIVIRFVLYRRKRTFKQIGFNKPTAFDIVNILAAYAVYAIVLRIIFAAVISLLPSVNLEQVQQTGYNNASGIDIVYAFFGLVILAPIFEELLFRGVLYNGLKSKLSVLPAAIITSIIFAVIHSPWTAQLDVFILSFALIWLLETTGSIWASIGLHMFKNFLAFYLLFILQR